MSNHNDLTIQAYENHFEEYMAALNQTPYRPTWMKDYLKGVDTGAAIFEIGSGSGRDADFIESLGYSVHRSDVAESFIKNLRHLGYEVMKFNLKTDEFPEPPYDVIIASAVLLHFNRDEFRACLRKIAGAINLGGRLIFSVQNGQGEEWKDNKGGSRYFHYWTEDEIRDEVNSVNMVVAELSFSEEGRWIRVAAQKPLGSKQT